MNCSLHFNVPAMVSVRIVFSLLSCLLYHVLEMKYRLFIIDWHLMLSIPNNACCVNRTCKHNEYDKTIVLNSYLFSVDFVR